MHDVRGYQIPTVKGEVAASVATINLLVYIDDERTRDAVIDRAERLARFLPARLVLLDATRAPQVAELAPPPLQLSQCELAILGLASETVLSLVSRALRPSLPTSLWWCSQSESRDGMFLGLAELAQRVIIDSSSSTGNVLLDDFTHLNARLPRLSLRDIAWKRLAPWRDAIARLFDDGTVTPELAKIIRVEISGDAESEARYLIGWLASCLGWSLAGERRFHDRNGGTINVLYTKASRGDMGIDSIRLRSASAEFSAHCTDQGDAIVCMHGKNGATTQQHLIPIAHVDQSTLIERALVRRGPDELFEGSLRIIRDLGPLAHQ